MCAHRVTNYLASETREENLHKWISYRVVDSTRLEQYTPLANAKKHLPQLNPLTPRWSRMTFDRRSTD